MTSPVQPPIVPMLARLVRDLPEGALTYEPKWDGFRCLAFVGPDGVDLRSRHDRPLARYFPEIVAGFEAVLAGRPGAPDERSFVVDGEILLAELGAGRGSAEAVGSGFAALMSRLHPAAARVERLRRETPARYAAFDMLADGSLDLTDHPFVERRAALERLLPDAFGVVTATPATRDPAVAVRWLEQPTPGIDGVVAKADDLPYAPGRRSMIKVKHLRTADCVVAGLRATKARGVTSLLLGLYDDTGALRHVGSVSQLTAADRQAMLPGLVALAIPLEDHPWRNGFTIGASPLGRLPGSAARWTPDMEHDWLPLDPVRVVEVGFDQVDGDRFRHPARFLRWRPDRETASCLLDQILATRERRVDEELVAGTPTR
ncbi:MAG TPA: ATP-dependent DNA ligase [Methylomirabilota bacterium]|nr:ATP-dependent DNA ligase [Methylomirabilota bacterium]